MSVLTSPTTTTTTTTTDHTKNSTTTTSISESTESTETIFRRNRSSSKSSRMLRFQRTLSVVKRGLSSSGRPSPSPSPAPSTVESATTTASSISSASASSSIYSKSPKSSPMLKKNNPIGDNDKFFINVSEAFAPKARSDFNKLWKTTSGNNRPDSGEDAFFTCQLTEGKRKGRVALGVADGVGGWAEIGVDPSEYSYRLCKNMEDRFKQVEKDDSDKQDISPSGLLKYSYNLLKDKQQVRAGSSTGCVGIVDPTKGSMQVANLGDSGYLIFRQGRLYRQSEPQTHLFNTPYQMAIIPDDLKVDAESRIDDKPEDADLTEHSLEHGDVVVFATDGLTDNMFAHEALDIVKDVMFRHGSWVSKKDVIEPGEQMAGGDELAMALVKHATNLSLDSRRNSPFTHELRRTVGIRMYGGKPDDITILVMLVD